MLRYGFATSPVEVQGLFFAAHDRLRGNLFQSVQLPSDKPVPNFGALFFMAQFAILLPGQIGGEMMAHRRPRIANEMLLPLSRTQLVDGLFAASAGNSARLWVIINIALGIVTLMAKDQVSLRTVAMFLIMSAAVMFAAFGMSMRVAVWPSMTKRLMRSLVQLARADDAADLCGRRCTTIGRDAPSSSLPLDWSAPAPGCFTPHDEPG